VKHQRLEERGFASPNRNSIGGLHAHPVRKSRNGKVLHPEYSPNCRALLFLEHGLQKYFGFPSAGSPMTSLLYVQGVIEIVGGILLLVGAYTRVVAFILAGDMAAAYFMAHFPLSFFPALNGGDAAVLFCFVFFYLFFAGGGSWSVDRAALKQS
jgi:putative oxidoreductase